MPFSRHAPRLLTHAFMNIFSVVAARQDLLILLADIKATSVWDVRTFTHAKAKKQTSFSIPFPSFQPHPTRLSRMPTFKRVRK